MVLGLKTAILRVICMVVFQGMKEMVQGGWLTTGFTWPPETLLAIHAPKETPVSMFSIRRTIGDKS